MADKIEIKEPHALAGWGLLLAVFAWILFLFLMLMYVNGDSYTRRFSIVSIIMILCGLLGLIFGSIALAKDKISNKASATLGLTVPLLASMLLGFLTGLS